MISCLDDGGDRRPYAYLGSHRRSTSIVHLPEWLRGFEQSYILITSSILIVILIVAPEGLAEAA